MRMHTALSGAILAGTAAGCFGAVAVTRSYFILHAEPVPVFEAPFPGLVRVRALDAESVYEKFQLVVRRSPYELKYSDLNVWAVRPNQMVRDVTARIIEQARAFEGVTTELGETRPKYTLGGELYAIEIYDSDDLWFAHLAIGMQLTVFSTGQRLWTYEFDRRKQVEAGNYSHAVRALSELLSEAVKEGLIELDPIAKRVRADPEQLSLPPATSPEIKVLPTPAGPSAAEPIFIPERGPPDDDVGPKEPD